MRISLTTSRSRGGAPGIPGSASAMSRRMELVPQSMAPTRMVGSFPWCLGRGGAYQSWSRQAGSQAQR